MEVEGVAKVSAKGQIVIPRQVRKRFELEPGKRLIVAVNKNGIILKKVDIDALVNEAIRWARLNRTITIMGLP